MSLREIAVEWEVFAAEGSVGVGAVRAVARDHLLVNIEGYGDVRIGPDQIAAAHDGKVILALDALPDDIAAAVRHAHDRETR